jgi:hypothetical protein
MPSGFTPPSTSQEPFNETLQKNSSQQVIHPGSITGCAEAGGYEIPGVWPSQWRVLLPFSCCLIER